ncbi:MAG: hypothetical protein AB3K77_14650 [Methanosarcinaceae archaeon]
MDTRNRIILTKAGLILLGLALIMSFSGCVGNSTENKVSAAEEINTSILLINNAEERIEKSRSDLESGAYTDSKVNLEASKIDFEEALKILDNAYSDYEEENRDIERFKILSSSGLDRINFSQNMVTSLEHMEKSDAYMSSEEIELSRKELDMASEALNESEISLNSAKEKIFSIDPEEVPVEEKSNIFFLRNSMENGEKMLLELKEVIRGSYPYLNVMEHLINVDEFIENEEWDKAALEYAEVSEDLSESKEIMEKLKNSEFSEISVESIEVCGLIDELEDNLPHLEAGCEYMDRGRYSQANEEFNKVSYIY